MKPRHSKAKKKSRKPAKRGERPAMLHITEEMREWAALLATELKRWPEVNSRPMFGMEGFYRKQKIFAAVPRTRALNSPTSVIFKLHGQPALKATKADDSWNRQRQRHDMEDSRLRQLQMSSSGWLSFELNSAEDLHDALYWFEQAYNKAQPPDRDKARSR